MNKQELIDELARHASCLEDFRGIIGHCDGKYEAYEIAIELAKQLDEPQKPVVPEFVAELVDWTNKMRCAPCEVVQDLQTNNELANLPRDLDLEKLSEYLEIAYHRYDFEKACFVGYEVEQEPLYMVPLLTDKEGNKKILVERRGEYDIIWDYENEGDWHELLTEEQIKSVNPDYWKFAVLYEPSEEVAEG
ncbi:DUF1642 domain-containing protein [Enterococcus faecium]|nr:DUF1642 domain-containing protein [Enterococcus faecium]